jgi:DNA-binding transcriptional regulator LsrR (DeoR family)
MRKSEIEKCDDRLVYLAAELRFGRLEKGATRLQMKQIAEHLQKKFPTVSGLTRESVYALIEEAVERRLMRLAPPLNQALGDELVRKYGLLAAGEVEVVDTMDASDNGKVAVAAAERAMRALERIAKKKKGPVGIGLGPGRATLEFCRHLSELLRVHSKTVRTEERVRVKLVAITAGCPVGMLEYAPISFLNLFPEDLVAGKVGLFAETLVPSREFKKIRQRMGVREAFAAGEDIDIVVTAMGDFHDEHDLLAAFLKDSAVDVNRLRQNGVIGNVQYRPYTKSGAVIEGPGDLRAVTVFEIQDLVKLATNRNKEVILMGRQCGLCKRTRAESLKPLLTNPDLKVFSTLVLDQETAEELVE